LRYYLDYSDVDAASMLGCAPGTLRSLCSRGIAALRLGSADQNDEPISSHPERLRK
jgi:DNA-directed RNA polymerase specialized sigma24 family protein